MNGLIEALGIPGTIIDEYSKVLGETSTNEEIKEGIIPLAIPSNKDLNLEDLVMASLSSNVTQDGTQVTKLQALKEPPPSSITFQLKRFGYVKLPEDQGGAYLKYPQTHEKEDLRGSATIRL